MKTFSLFFFFFWHLSVLQYLVIVLCPMQPNSVCNVNLSSIQFEDQDTCKVIYSLNYNKAHGYDNIKNI